MERFAPLFLAGLAHACLLRCTTGAQLHGNMEGRFHKAEQQSEGDQQSFFATAELANQSLMICNAFAHEAALHIFDLNKNAQLSGNRPLGYKVCADYNLPLVDGERLDFRANNVSVGVFRAVSVPRAAGSLLLIVHRRNPSKINAAFVSHVFAQPTNSQLIILDMYHGNATGKVRIADAVKQDQQAEANLQRSVDLTLNSVVQLNPGDYHVSLLDVDRDISTVSLRVPNKRSNFVIMRVGNEPDTKMAEPNLSMFSQELVLHRQHESESSAGVVAELQFLAAAVMVLLTLAAGL